MTPKNCQMVKIKLISKTSSYSNTNSTNLADKLIGGKID